MACPVAWEATPLDADALPIETGARQHIPPAAAAAQSSRWHGKPRSAHWRTWAFRHNEGYPHAELDHARLGGARRPPECGAVQIAVHVPEVHAVEDVERVDPQLQLAPRAHDRKGRVLHEAEIDLREAGAAIRETRQGAERAGRGQWKVRRREETRHVLVARMRSRKVPRRRVRVVVVESVSVVVAAVGAIAEEGAVGVPQRNEVGTIDDVDRAARSRRCRCPRSSIRRAAPWLTALPPGQRRQVQAAREREAVAPIVIGDRLVLVVEVLAHERKSCCHG